jgi:lipopolysaccharide/colanic/teichoic acid biosynthesis glycosyltransferase
MYIENYSILLDIKLILLTLRIILKKESTEGFEVQEEMERKKMEMLSGIPDSNAGEK